MYKLTILLSICAVLLVFSQGIAEGATATDTPNPGTCGVENETGNDDYEISGGNKTDENQYPWMVHLPMGCGGSLITDRHVLTAKHCVEARNISWRGKMIKFAVHNINDKDDYQEVAIKDYVMPDTDELLPEFLQHDIAIIILENKVDLSDNKIGTVCLPANNQTDYRGKNATAMGWGFTEVGSGDSPVLKHENLTVSQNESKNFLNTTVSEVNGVPQDPCKGDSGGPLVYKEESGRWTIVGTLYGAGFDCDDGIIKGEGKWNKVTAHLAWIHKVIEE